MLVHGGGADHTRLEPFADFLTARFTVHLVDRRGRGMSGDGDIYDIELEYDDIAAVAEAIGQEVTLLGHSYGGPIAIGAAARTDAIAGVIAMKAGPPWRALHRRMRPEMPPSESKRSSTPMTKTAPSAWSSATWWGLTRRSSRRCEHSRSGRPGSLQQSHCRGNCEPIRSSKWHRPT